MKWKGYGESKLVNKCKNDVICTEEEHQQNRRTEFKVIKIMK
jgi:outer membrane protein OmpA-like peptidoglycan-associated protein